MEPDSKLLELDPLRFFTIARGASLGIPRRIVSRIINAITEERRRNPESTGYLLTMGSMILTPRARITRICNLGKDSLSAMIAMLEDAGISIPEWESEKSFRNVKQSLVNDDGCTPEEAERFLKIAVRRGWVFLAKRTYPPG